MYEQKRTEVNKSAEKFEKEMKAAKRSGNKANQVRHSRSRPSLVQTKFVIIILWTVA